MNFRKMLTGALAGVMMTSLLCLGGAFAEEDPVNGGVYNAPKIPEGYTINLDGKLDPIWYTCEPQAIQKTDKTSTFYKDGYNTTGTLRIMWDDHGFYTFVEVDKHGTPVVFDSSPKSWMETPTAGDAVQFGWALNGAMNWTCPSDSTVAYNGGVTVDVDGDLNLGGWFWWYGQDSVKGVMRQTADDKYTVEIYCDWVNPLRDDVYGPAGQGEGNCFCFDAIISSHDGEITTGGGKNGTLVSMTAWSMYPYNYMSGCSVFGWVVLDSEPDFDPDEIERLAKENIVVTPVTPDDGNPTEDVSDSEKTPSADNTEKKEEKKDNGKKDNSSDNPKTLDVVSVTLAAAVISFGTAVIIKKKRR